MQRPLVPKRVKAISLTGETEAEEVTEEATEVVGVDMMVKAVEASEEVM